MEILVIALLLPCFITLFNYIFTDKYIIDSEDKDKNNMIKNYHIG